MFLANVVNLVNVSQFQLFDESVSLIVVISKLFRFVQPHLVYHYIVRIVFDDLHILAFAF